MKKLIVLLFVLILFVGGCEALTMSPDTWLDPHRWAQEEADSQPETYAKSSLR